MSVSRIYRLLRLITMLQGSRSYTAHELAEELEVSRRTIFRDLNMLELAHIPYYYDPKSGGYKVNQHFFLPPINLTVSEALAVLVLAGRLRGAKRLPLLTHGVQAAAKLESVLPKPIREHIGSVIDHLSVALGPVSSHKGLDSTFEELVGAIGKKRICRIVYMSFHEREQIRVTVYPLRLMFLSRAWYLIAHSVQHKEIRTFKVSRIRKLTVTDRGFTRPAKVDLDEYFGDAWNMIPEGKLYKVHLHFDPKVAGNVAEVGWHKNQKFQWNQDGSIEYYVTVDGLGEITWWILGYGDQVEVIAPAALRNRVRKVATAVVSKYRKEAS